jgi:hypothetical protein
VLLRLSREEPLSLVPSVGIFSDISFKYVEGRKVLWTGFWYSMDWWVWWKTRWEQLAGGVEFDQDVRTHAKEALVAMEEAEL